VRSDRLQSAGRAWLSEAWLLAEALMALSVYTVLPLAWFWVAAQVEAEGPALALVTALLGYGLTASLALLLLRAMDGRRRHLLEHRGLGDDGYDLPERLIVWQTVALVLVLAVWFVLGSGANAPLPR
jgi:hypothetical protein